VLTLNSMKPAKPDRSAVQKTVHQRYSAQLLQISLNYAKTALRRHFQLTAPALSYARFHWVCSVSRQLIILWSTVRVRVGPPTPKPRTARLFSVLCCYPRRRAFAVARGDIQPCAIRVSGSSRPWRCTSIACSSTSLSMPATKRCWLIDELERTSKV